MSNRMTNLLIYQINKLFIKNVVIDECFDKQIYSFYNLKIMFQEAAKHYNLNRLDFAAIFISQYFLIFIFDKEFSL